MFLIIGIAATAAASVLVFARWRERQPELAIETTQKARQFAAVVIVLVTAVESVLEALVGRGRAIPSHARSSYEPRWEEDESW